MLNTMAPCCPLRLDQATVAHARNSTSSTLVDPGIKSKNESMYRSWCQQHTNCPEHGNILPCVLSCPKDWLARVLLFLLHGFSTDLGLLGHSLDQICWSHPHLLFGSAVMFTWSHPQQAAKCFPQKSDGQAAHLRQETRSFQQGSRFRFKPIWVRALSAYRCIPKDTPRHTEVAAAPLATCQIPPKAWRI